MGSVSIIAGTLGGAGFAGDGNKATGAQLSNPQGVAVDAASDVWFADSGNNRIRAIGIDGTIQTVIGNGNTTLAPVGTDPLQLALNLPDALIFDSSGVLYWTETLNHRIRSWNPKTRQLRDVAGATLPLTTTGPATSLALFNPNAAVTDSAGNLFIADSANHVIRKILPNGTSSIVAGTGVRGFNIRCGHRDAGYARHSPGSRGRRGGRFADCGYRKLPDPQGGSGREHQDVDGLWRLPAAHRDIGNGVCADLSVRGGLGTWRHILRRRRVFPNPALRRCDVHC